VFPNSSLQHASAGQPNPIIYIDSPVYPDDKKNLGFKKLMLFLSVLQAILGTAAIVIQVLAVIYYIHKLKF